MISRKITLVNEKGLHLRPAGRVCELALTYKAKATMKTGAGEYNLKSMLSVLAAQVIPGTELEIICEGPDEKDALESLCSLLTSDLDAKPADKGT